MTTFTTRSKVIEENLIPCIDMGLKAGARVILNAVKVGLKNGYTSGRFVQGVSFNMIRMSEPFEGSDGGRSVRVGMLYLNPPYPLYWELGHQNLFTGKFERKEVWRPAMENNADAASKAFTRVFLRKMGEALRAAGLVDPPPPRV